MIARVWRGWLRAQDADGYDRHYRAEVLSTLRAVNGFAGARLMRRAVGDEVEFLSITYFADMDAVRRFAGDDPEIPVIAEAVRDLFIRYDTLVRHYEVDFET
ncbi:antibiotic biosynthesis monooxygenase [Catenuloplanes atrovinosus]|uniref:Heme-degrading monooxygenase HmoA n=1 Tax=Catenuloplanes atrovinosus TaxID=137266 RepID=A0AAE4CAR5_9ACTN|nr:antibiotic biosynthesis monooxygenase [Catenuloplanes atrovinosus]MDR7274860.1 heme-degrading monooxygenase HmoA [Catenuloplanes atrovinosus]